MITANFPPFDNIDEIDFRSDSKPHYRFIETLGYSDVSCVSTDNPNCTATDGQPHPDNGVEFIYAGDQSPIPKSTTYKTDGPVMYYNKEENKLTPIRDFMTGAEKVNHPSHYTSGKIEVIDFIEDQKLGFHLGNAVKYICRAGKKDPDKVKEDLDKAIWYINRYKESLE